MSNEYIERDCNEKERVYNALSIAASRIGANNYRKLCDAARAKGRKVKNVRYVPTDAHKRVIDTINAFMSGALSANDAMAVLHEYDVFKERIG